MGIITKQLFKNTQNKQNKMMKFTVAASALALSAFAQVHNDYVQCAVYSSDCNPDNNPNVCYYIADDEDCQTYECNSMRWAPKIFNLKQAQAQADYSDNLTVHMMNREKLVIEVDRNMLT